MKRAALSDQTKPARQLSIMKGAAKIDAAQIHHKYGNCATILNAANWLDSFRCNQAHLAIAWKWNAGRYSGACHAAPLANSFPIPHIGFGHVDALRAPFPDTVAIGCSNAGCTRAPPFVAVVFRPLASLPALDREQEKHRHPNAGSAWAVVFYPAIVGQNSNIRRRLKRSPLDLKFTSCPEGHTEAFPVNSQRVAVFAKDRNGSRMWSIALPSSV
jgi:hypothetical protein